MTGTDLVEQAYRRANIITPVDPLSPEELRDGFILLQEVSEEMMISRKMIPAAVRRVFDLVSGQVSYTIGSGADFDVVRPNWIDGVGVVLDSTATPKFERDIGPMLTRQQYQDLSAKELTTSGYPNRCYYDDAFDATTGFGTIYPYPVTTLSSVQLALYIATAFQRFDNYSDDIIFPPGYAQHLRLQVALKACTTYGVPFPNGLEKEAQKAEARIKRANFRLTDARMPAGIGTRRGGYNIYTDGG